MEKKITTKRIVIWIAIILVLCLAVVGAILLLKNSGIMDVQVEEQNPITDVQPDDENKADEDKNKQENTSNIEDVENNGSSQNVNSSTQNGNDTQYGPVATTVEKEKIISETTTLGWNNIVLNGETTQLLINYNNLTYKVEYYFDNVIDETLTEYISGKSKGDIVDSYTDKIKDGYKLEIVENYPLTISHDETKNIIKVKYVSRDDIKYRVEHYLQNTGLNGYEFKEGKDYTGVFGTEATYSANTYVGFTYDETLTTPENKTITADGELVIKLYYNRKQDVKYRVEHYLQNVDLNGYTFKEGSDYIGVFGKEATYSANTYQGFTYDETLTTPADKTITADGDLVIKLYYNRKQDIKYRVEHYLQNVDLNGYTFKEGKDYTGIFGAEAEYVANTYEGFVYDETLTTPEDKRVTADDELVIKLYYNRATNVKYRVEHYLQDLNLSGYAFKEGKDYTGVFGTEATYSANTYQGFTYDETLTTPVEKIITADGELVIKLYYKRNKSEYIVKHYYQGLDEDEFFQDEINAPDERYEAYFGQIVTEDGLVKKQISGYVYLNAITNEQDKTLPLVVVDGENIINLYYVRDHIEYEIRYYKDSIVDTNYLGNVEDYAIYGETIVADTTLYKPEGYKFEGEAPNMVIHFENNLLNVVYIKDDFAYRIEYYYDGEIDNSKTEKGTATFKDKITTYKDKIKDGYKLEKVQNLPLTISAVASKNVIKVYYAKPNISIQKTAVKTVNAGDEFTYYIKLTNSAKVSGKISVIDALPGEVEYVSSTHSGEYSVDEHTVEWKDIEVGKSSSVTIELVVKVHENRIGHTITNTAVTNENKESTCVVTVNELTVLVEDVKEGTQNRDNVNIILVMDLSSSMNEKDGGTQTRLEVAKLEAQAFIRDIYDNELNKHATVSLITFNTKSPEYSNGKVVAYTGTKQLGNTVTLSNYETLVTEIGKIDIGTATSGYGTHIGAAMDATLSLVKQLEVSYPNNKNVVVLLGDGNPTTSYSNNSYNYITGVANSIKNREVEIHTVGFGSDITTSSLAYRLLKAISSNGEILTAADRVELAASFSNIADQIVDEQVKTSLGKLKFSIDTSLVVNENHPIILEYKGKEIFKCTSEDDMGLYYITYNSSTKELVFDINAYNSVEVHTKLLSNDVKLIHYESK